MNKPNRGARHAFLYVLIGLGVAAGLAGAVSLSSQGAQGARVQRLNAALQAQNLPNFTLEQQAAIARTRQGILHPAWSTLSSAEKFDRVARFAEQLFAATPTATLPTPANFLGNLTALAFAHTGANAFSLRRQGDCSLSLLQDSYAYGSTGMSALTLSAATSSVPHYEQTLHANAGLGTPVDAFAGGCSDAAPGAGSQRWVSLGRTSAGLPRFAGVGYYPTSGNNALWYGIENPVGTMSATFQTDTSLPGIGTVAAGDLNGDGFIDVVGIDQLHGQIAVWLANADGSLKNPVLYALPGTLTEGAVIADVNGDGKADVVAASSVSGGSEQLSVLTGNGDGTLNAARSSALPTPGGGTVTVYFGTLVAADLRHTGHPDLVGSNGTVLFNDGAGNFTAAAAAAFPPLQASSGFGPNLTAADFNKDGIVDLAVDTGPLIRVYLGKGDGTFTAKASYAATDNVGYLGAADLDGDGNVDLWSGLSGGGVFGGDQYGTEQADALMGNGDGTFQSAPSLPFVYTGTNVADLNADGIRDAIGVNSDLSLTPYLGSAAGRFTAGASVTTSPVTVGGTAITLSNIGSLAIGDINGDGAVDVAYTATDVNSASHTFVAYGDGHGGFGAPNAIPQPSLAGGGDTDTNEKISNLRLADVNGDGKLDLVYAYSDLGSPSGTYVVANAVQLGKGDGTFEAPAVIPFYSGSTQIYYSSVVAAIGDVNGDGKPDLLLLSQAPTTNAVVNSYPAQMQVALGHGDGTFATPATVAGPDLMVTQFYGTQYAPLVLVDMNGDGKPDLVASGSSTTGSPQVAVSLGNGDGTFQAPVKQTYSGQFLNGQGLGVADFNGDGKPDVVLTNPYSVFASGISLGNGDGSLQVTGDSSGTYVNYNFSLTVGGATLVYDMNGDGRPDILATSTQLFGQAAPSGSGAAATPDFALTASVAAGTVSPGAAATTTLTITPSGGFDQAVTLSCSAVPATAGCSFAPASVTPNGTPVTSTLTISTMAAALNGVPGAIDPTLPSGLLLATVGVALTCRRRELRRLRERRLRAGRLRAVAALGVLVALCVLAACGRGDLGVPASVTGAGSTGGAPATGGGTPGTAAGTYTIKITATAGTTVHNVTYTLTVT